MADQAKIDEALAKLDSIGRRMTDCENADADAAWAKADGSKKDENPDDAVMADHPMTQRSFKTGGFSL